jgi:hypothetical protein
VGHIIFVEGAAETLPLSAMLTMAVLDNMDANPVVFEAEEFTSVHWRCVRYVCHAMTASGARHAH